MCEYCNINDIDRINALDAINHYSSMERDSIVLIDIVFEHMFAIYGNINMADCAVKRIERKNVKCTPKGHVGVLVKDVVSELEALLSCRGGIGHNLDG
ncbi:MAG: hypothetical protein AABX27_01680 [Nanoarchaeota archaeon]